MLAKAVRRGLRTPFLSATCRSAPTRSPTSRRSRTALRFVKEAGCDAVKLEGGGPTSGRARPRDRRTPASRSWATSA